MGAWGTKLISLLQVKCGTLPNKVESPYENPAKNESAIYSQLKKEGITTIHADAIQ